MKKNSIIGLGAVCFVVVFALMIFGAIAVQKVSSGDVQEETQEIEFKESPQDNEFITSEDDSPSKILAVTQSCQGNARCISGFVTRIIDGDTIDVDGQSIRFVLVNTPEYGENDYTQARNYIQTICPIGTPVLVDEDDLQTKGSHGRIIGVIYCNNLNLSEEILEAGHAEIIPSICSKSEFADEPWALKFGC